MANPKERKSYLAIGQIVGPHGIRGEVKVQSLTDFPERFKPGVLVLLGAGPGAVDVRSLTISASRPHQDHFLILFAGIKDRDAAETLRWQYLLIPEEDAMPLGEHENYLHDLLGLTVITHAGELIGELKEIVLTPANDVYVVQGKGGEVLIPATREVVVTVDLAARTMTVVLPDGLLSPVDGDAEDADDDLP